MTTPQLTLTEDQWASLQTIAQKTGQTAEELVIAAVERFIQEFQQQQERRLAAFRQARGMWADRTDLPSLEALRSEWERYPVAGENSDG